MGTSKGSRWLKCLALLAFIPASCGGDDLKEAQRICKEQCAYDRPIEFRFAHFPSANLSGGIRIILKDKNGNTITTEVADVRESTVLWSKGISCDQQLEFSVGQHKYTADSFKLRPRPVTAGIGNTAYDGCTIAELKINGRWLLSDANRITIYADSL